ncbi:MAG: hypothetical protein MZU84_04690 [Sphingobacterium sp.]|nr:hypothetical protein [Sphingobacterium sp.]
MSATSTSTRLKRPAPGDTAEQKAKVFTRRGGRDRGDRREVRLGRAHGAQEGRRRVAHRRADRGEGRRRRGDRHRHQPGVARDPARGRGERHRPRPVRPCGAAHRGGLQDGRPGRRVAAPARRHERDRRRDLRQAAGERARLPGVVVPRVHVQQGHVRPARQDGPGLRPRRGRCPRGRDEGRAARVREVGRGVGADQPGRGPRRPGTGPGRHRQPADTGDEVHRRARRGGEGPREVRPRQAGTDRHGGRREHPRHARGRQDGRERERLRSRRRQLDGRDHRPVADQRPAQHAGQFPAERRVRVPIVHRQPPRGHARHVHHRLRARDRQGRHDEVAAAESREGRRGRGDGRRAERVLGPVR